MNGNCFRGPWFFWWEIYLETRIWGLGELIGSELSLFLSFFNRWNCCVGFYCDYFLFFKAVLYLFSNPQAKAQNFSPPLLIPCFCLLLRFNENNGFQHCQYIYLFIQTHNPWTKFWMTASPVKKVKIYFAIILSFKCISLICYKLYIKIYITNIYICISHL